MADFEDDLFADLYNDDEPSAQPAGGAIEPTPSAPALEAAYETYEETGYTANQNGSAEAQMKDEYDEDDDDIEFNLGGDNEGPAAQVEPIAYNPPAPAPQTRGPNAKEDGKMFIGGLNWETTDQSLRDYFSQFGEVLECTVMRDGATGRSRGFGFLTFKDAKTVNVVMVKEHHLDGKIIDPKRAIPRDEQEKTSKIFVGGVSQDTTDQEFREYFSQFGRVIDSTLMMDKDTGRPRGFGFVTFESEAGVENCLTAELAIHGKPIEVKRAQPRGNMREEEEANRRGGAGKFGRKGGNNGIGGEQEQAGAGGQMAGAGGMTPQVMAQYWQRMQQYFAMMQQQMAMNRGMGMGGMQMNPQMMQMMQMQQMQQQMMAAQGRGGAAAAGGNGNMGNMTPQMMQQMQQMMQQQAGAQGGGMQMPDPGQGGGNRAGYNAMEEQMFEEQKYDPSANQPQQQVQQQQREPRQPRQQQQQFNQGGGYGMGGGGGGGPPPTSWEGMYDDVPQPGMNQGGGGRGGFRNRGHHQQNHHQQHQQGPMDPNNAPPANAPTGPKNAGRPGANYRGGGRGGSRGFHPYARG